MSLAEQSDQRFNVYIGNDSSPENPEELLKEFYGKFNFKYKNFGKNFGGSSLTKQWERCIDMLQNEEWFMILGDDDYLSCNVVEEFYRNQELTETEDISVIKFNSAIVDASSVVQSEKISVPLIKSSIDHFFDKFMKEGRSSLSEHLFKKSKYEKYGFLDLPFAWHSDDLAILEFSEYGNLLFLEEAKCFVRVSSKSITGNKTAYKEEKRNASKMFFNHLCQNLNKFSVEEKRQLFNIIQWYEKDKKFKIEIPKKMYEYYKCYGFGLAIKLLLVK